MWRKKEHTKSTDNETQVHRDNDNQHKLSVTVSQREKPQLIVVERKENTLQRIYAKP